MKLGHVLVVDEADKAPTNVTCILKSLVESGEMILADGRKIVSGECGVRFYYALPDLTLCSNVSVYYCNGCSIYA